MTRSSFPSSIGRKAAWPRSAERSTLASAASSSAACPAAATRFPPRLEVGQDLLLGDPALPKLGSDLLPRLPQELHPELPGKLPNVLERHENALWLPVPRHEDHLIPANESGNISPELPYPCHLHTSHGNINVYTIKDRLPPRREMGPGGSEKRSRLCNAGCGSTEGRRSRPAFSPPPTLRAQPIPYTNRRLESLIQPCSSRLPSIDSRVERPASHKDARMSERNSEGGAWKLRTPGSCLSSFCGHYRGALVRLSDRTWVQIRQPSVSSRISIRVSFWQL